MVPISLAKWAIITPPEQLHVDGLPYAGSEPIFKVEFFVKIVNS